MASKQPMIYRCSGLIYRFTPGIQGWRHEITLNCSRNDTLIISTRRRNMPIKSQLIDMFFERVHELGIFQGNPGGELCHG